MKTSKTLIIILTIGALLIVGALIFREYSNKKEDVEEPYKESSYDTLEDIMKDYMVTSIEENSYYKVLSYKDRTSDITYYGMVDSNDNIIEKFNNINTYKLYNHNGTATKFYVVNDTILKYDKEVINENIDSIYSLEDSIVVVNEQNKNITYSYYNLDKVLDHEVKGILYGLNNSRAIFKTDDLFYLINTDTYEILSKDYAKLGDFISNYYTNNDYDYLTFMENDKYGIIDINGNVVIDAMYDNLSVISNGYFAYTDNTSYLINKNNEVLLNADIFYGSIEGYIISITNDEYKIYDALLNETDVDKVRFYNTSFESQSSVYVTTYKELSDSLNYDCNDLDKIIIFDNENMFILSDKLININEACKTKEATL